MSSSVVRKQESAATDGAPMIDLDALDATPLRRDPFDFLVVPSFLRPDALARAIADYPDITGPGNHNPEALHYGPAFGALLEELDSSALEEHLGAKFGVDLSSGRLTITIRRFCEPTDGHIHTDHRTKIITMLVYLNEGWNAEGGRLRFLRSADDLEDYVAEVTPLGGTMLGAGRCHGGHGARGDAPEPRASRRLRGPGSHPTTGGIDQLGGSRRAGR